jgi:hypothetical protein
MTDNKKLSKLENKFNIILLGMIKYITNYQNDAKITVLSTLIEQIISNKPDEPISCFLLYIYRNDDYRINILNENDAFFMNHDISEIGNSMIKQVFEFKELWKKINDETKQYIKRSMKALVLISQKYILSI